MKVLRLVMTSFGTQQNKIIDFSENVNLVMGSDMGTLQTVRSFLDGMLFGLSAEDKKRYRPKRLPYSGSMFIAVDDGEQLRIDRNFLNGQFKVTDSDGNDVTDDYSDEYGDLALLPVADSIFPRETFKIRESSDKDRKKLSELKAKRRAHENRYNYEEMLEQRQELLTTLNEHRLLEEEMEQNSSVISENEERIKSINEANNSRGSELDREIAELKEKSETIMNQIEELKREQIDKGVGKAQILKRNVQGTQEQLELVDKRLSELKSEKKSYTKKLEELKERFNVDRDELKSDYEAYQEEQKKITGPQPEPLVDRLTGFNNWFYAVVIIIGVAGVVYALANPGDNISRVPVFLLCFISVFIILISSFALYLRLNNKIPVAQPAEGSTEEEEATSKILKKYNQNSASEFDEFYNNAKKVYVHMDDLESDLDDIEREIKESETEKNRIFKEKQKLTRDLAENRVEYQDDTIQEKIVELTKQRNKIEAQIEEYEEEKQKPVEVTDSIWKLKEEALKLKETNTKLKNQSSDGESVIDDFYKLQDRIDRYETKLGDLDKQIAAIEDNLSNARHNFIVDYATPGDEDFNEKMAKQFAFGLQRNLRKGYEVPLITYNPFVNAGSEDDALAEKFKTFIMDKQVLIFTTQLSEQEILAKHHIKHNGIYIASTKAL